MPAETRSLPISSFLFPVSRFPFPVRWPKCECNANSCSNRRAATTDPTKPIIEGAGVGRLRYFYVNLLNLLDAPPAKALLHFSPPG